MFISSTDAEARLSSDKNLFRDTTSVSGDGSTSASKSAGAPEHKEPLKQDTPIDDSDDEPSISLSHLDDLIHTRIGGRARYHGKLESQVAIAETGLILGTTQASKIFGLSNGQAIAYRAGLKTSDGSPTAPKPELKARIDAIKSDLALAAADRLGLTLNALSPDKISSIKRATNLAKVGKDMAVIMEKCLGTEKSDDGGVHFHIYRPEMQVEQSYKTVTVGAFIDVPKSESA